jgi:hypothetical protein
MSRRTAGYRRTAPKMPKWSRPLRRGLPWPTFARSHLLPDTGPSRRRRAMCRRPNNQKVAAPSARCRPQPFRSCGIGSHIVARDASAPQRRGLKSLTHSRAWTDDGSVSGPERALVSQASDWRLALISGRCVYETSFTRDSYACQGSKNVEALPSVPSPTSGHSSKVSRESFGEE